MKALKVFALFAAICLSATASWAATITKPFNMSLGTTYSGLSSTISYKILSYDGTTLVAQTTPGVGVTEGSMGAFTASGSYNVSVANFDTSWVGRIVWYESTNGILYEEPFTATQSGDNNPTIASKLDTNVGSRQASGAAVTLPATLPAGSITTATFAAGATLPAVTTVGATGTVIGAVTVGANNDKTGYSLSSNERSTLTTSILTDATGANQATPGSLGSMVLVNNGIAVLGTVNDANPGVGSFVVSLATGTLPADNRFVGLSLSFTGSLAPAKAKITSYQLLTGTTARVWFANPFGVVPTNGAAFTIF